MAALQGGRAYLMGLGQGIWATARGTVNAVIHPIDTINGAADGLGTLAGRAIYDTAGLGSDMWNGAVDTVNDPGRLGNAVGNLVGGVAIGGATSGGFGAMSRSLTTVKNAAARGALSAGARTEAANLAEQLTLNEAQAGAGERIMKGAIKDTRFPEDVWAKMQHVHDTPGGEAIIVHYWENLQTAERIGFKFKNP